MDLRHTLAVFVLATTAAVVSADTEGRVRLTFTTRRTTGKYAPKHVLAVWVIDGQGKFVRTLLLHGRKQTKRLTAWSEDSDRNKVDAVTGATLRSHGERTVTWDCRDASGDLVPDGDYHLRVEFTESNKSTIASPPTGLRVVKGPESLEKKFGGNKYIFDGLLTYTPASQ